MIRLTVGFCDNKLDDPETVKKIEILLIFFSARAKNSSLPIPISYVADETACEYGGVERYLAELVKEGILVGYPPPEEGPSKFYALAEGVRLNISAGKL